MTNSNPTNFILFMYGRIRKAQYGEFRNLLYRKRKFEFKDTYMQRHGGKWISHCPECKVHLKSRGKKTLATLTIDHIIPLWVCYEYNMPQLEFDLRNFRALCAGCNALRGHKEWKWDKLSLSEALKASILRQSAAWEQTRAELSTTRAESAQVSIANIA